MRKFLASALLLCGFLGFAQADDEKPIKSDVVIKQDDKGGEAKVGEIVEIKIHNPPVVPMVSDLKVTITGKALDSKHRVRHTVDMKDGKVLVGSGYESVYVKARAKGRAKVKVEYKKGDTERSHEYEIVVK